MTCKYTDLDSLTQLFRDAGALQPELRAQSQIREGINQLGRFSFLKSISWVFWKDDDFELVDRYAQFESSDDPLGQIGGAVREMLSKGVSRESILDLIRCFQFETAFSICSVIDMSSEITTPVDSWALFETNEDEIPVSAIGGLHESLLEFDPSGKEFRPRSTKPGDD